MMNENKLFGPHNSTLSLHLLVIFDSFLSFFVCAGSTAIEDETNKQKKALHVHGTPKQQMQHNYYVRK